MIFTRRMLLVCAVVASIATAEAVLVTLGSSCGFVPVRHPPAGTVKSIVFMWNHVIIATHYVSGLILPSVLIFLLCERLLPRRRLVKHFAFIISLLPFTALMTYWLFETSGETAHPLTFIVPEFCYLSQGTGAYILLVVTSRREPVVRAGE